MQTYQVQLLQPWPTALGLRRPQEGVISVSAADAEAIEQAGAGEILDIVEAEKPKRGKRQTPAAAAEPTPAS